MPSHSSIRMWRLHTVRALAWALLLGGWVGLGSFAQALAPGTFSPFGLLAAWLLATAIFETCIDALRLRPWTLRGLLLGAPALVAWALHAALHGRGFAALWLASLAWAWICAIAMVSVRACREAGSEGLRRRSSALAAASGAFLVWIVAGDIGHLNVLQTNLTSGTLVACLLLAALMPRRRPAPGTDGPADDCASLIWLAGRATAWRRGPLVIASLAMPAMMSSLPQMVALCRSTAVSPQWVLGLHLAAMFMPAVLLADRPSGVAVAPVACACLLVVGALVLLFAPDATVWWGVALAHGSAWSLGWAARPESAEAGLRAPSFAGIATSAMLVAVLGAAVVAVGIRGIEGWHLLLGLAALLTIAVPIVRGLHSSHAAWGAYLTPHHRKD